MSKKTKILGLDLGTNSIGWALIENNFDTKEGRIIDIGSRIIPMDQAEMSKFDSGQSISQTAERTAYRGVRRLTERNLLRRERLHRVLNKINFLPAHYSYAIDFEKRLGQFKKLDTENNSIVNNKNHFTEIKLNYKINKEGKHEFIFMDTFEEMLLEFKTMHPKTFEAGINGNTCKIPLDWTIYYLRKKALTKKISKEELAWLILNFNQKRGYYQLRGDETENDSNKNEDFHSLKVVNVEATEDNNAKGVWYNVHLENSWIYRRQSKESLDSWVGINKEFIVTTNTDKDGELVKDKDGNIKRSFRAVDSKVDWIAIKKKTEQELENSLLHVGEYIYSQLLINPSLKLNGGLIKTIERKLYKKELIAILDTQKQFHEELQDAGLYKICLEELYPINEAHRNNIKDKDLNYLLIEDIIFYQRPLKSKKSSISNCPYESRKFTKNNIKEIQALKCVPKSHPLFQEFRLWQFIRNLKIYEREAVVEGKTKLDVDVTKENIISEEGIFSFLNSKKEISQKILLKELKLKETSYRWNYVEGDKKYPCNETRSSFISRFNKVTAFNIEEHYTTELEENLWHIIYSVKEKDDFKQALRSFAIKNNINEESFLERFIKYPAFTTEYGAYSLKALKKLVPFMRTGKYWNKENLNATAQGRIEDIIERLETINYNKDKLNSVADDDIKTSYLKSFTNFKEKSPFKALNTYQACYAVYGRHSEVSDIDIWKQPKQIEEFLYKFKQHSLKNPTVEKVVNETLRLVCDIWKKHGDSKENFFDEIHVELGREMKSSADKRKSISERQTENENTNQRIKDLLQEIKDDTKTMGDVRPFSPSHQEILKIYEEGVLSNPNVSYKDLKEDEIIKIRKKSAPTANEINKYKLWLEQGYISPYTGKIIPLSRLFTTDYQIEHVIPQSRYFDNSLNNKIICESEVNELKSNKTAYEFIKNNPGRKVALSDRKTVDIFCLEAYEDHCKRYFKNSRTKLKLLLSEDIPEGFINRQLNDSRYISKLICGLLSNIVREENEKEATAKRLVPITGAITSIMKQDWGLNDKWNEIVAPRFKRLNEITKSEDYGYWDKNINAFRTQVPKEIAVKFNKKRIDHRHHALDALIVACLTKDHTSYITSLNTERENYALVNKLRNREKIERKNINGKMETINAAKSYKLPWKTFPVDAKDALEKTIVSFKQNLRVINKTNNKYLSYKDEDGNIRLDKNGNPKKALTKQINGNNWAIRKSMHKETVSAAVEIKTIKKTEVSINNYIENWQLIVDKNIRYQMKNINKMFDKDVKEIKKYLKNHPIKKNEEKVQKIKVYEILKKDKTTATRTELNTDFLRKHINSVTDSGIQLILNNHVKNYIVKDEKTGKETFPQAFTPEGIAELNKNIIELNLGRFHHPIKKVRVYESGKKFAVGENANKKDKFVEAAKGTNLFFAIYWDEKNNKRAYDTVPLNEVIAHQKDTANLPKNEKTPIAIKHEKGVFLFTLSPNDLVYVPTDEEIENPNIVDFDKLSKEQVDRVYNVNDFSSTCYFTPNSHATKIEDKEVDMKYDNKKNKITGSYDDKTASIDGIQIKDICWKLQVDRLGKIQNVIKHTNIKELEMTY